MITKIYLATSDKNLSSWIYVLLYLSFKELLDDPYSDLKGFADSALSEQDSSQMEKVIITDSDVRYSDKQPQFFSF